MYGSVAVTDATTKGALLLHSFISTAPRLHFEAPFPEAGRPAPVAVGARCAVPAELPAGGATGARRTPRLASPSLLLPLLSCCGPSCAPLGDTRALLLRFACFVPPELIPPIVQSIDQNLEIPFFFFFLFCVRHSLLAPEQWQLNNLLCLMHMLPYWLLFACGLHGQKAEMKMCASVAVREITGDNV